MGGKFCLFLFCFFPFLAFMFTVEFLYLVAAGVDSFADIRSSFFHSLGLLGLQPHALGDYWVLSFSIVELC